MNTSVLMSFVPPHKHSPLQIVNAGSEAGTVL